MSNEYSGPHPLYHLPQDMRDGLTKFDAEAKAIVSSFLESMESREPPKLIYHYTNDAGLRGILETGQLWLTDIFNLNDPSELSHGFSHAVNILNCKSEQGPPESRVFAKNFSAFHQNGMRGSAHYFVCSFSTDGNDLGQWRAYADNGRGYAIGFDAKALEDAFTKENGAPIPNNCTFHLDYKDAVLENIHRQMIERMFDLISLPRGRNLDSTTINSYMTELSVLLSVHVLRSALFFKHGAYTNEMEFRFLEVHRADVPPPEVKQRYRSYELVKYREFDWKRLHAGALKQIIVGPAADCRKATQFAADCMAAFGIQNVEITCSTIPYRAL
ncbi:MAG: DUF2971 domain-containing protein [Gammaproteobacteria bacterium]|nr:DUF2971 domain-containing protein [Gammaproteobacteria bacterium]MBU1777788.1 DUF2971 domain-containing protein [Gammaproteobacteria bacterium]MBU1969683.1 DUF2971 domain-containing protein [Gammaproteobacteria bacterium]